VIKIIKKAKHGFYFGLYSITNLVDLLYGSGSIILLNIYSTRDLSIIAIE